MHILLTAMRELWTRVVASCTRCTSCAFLALNASHTKQRSTFACNRAQRHQHSETSTARCFLCVHTISNNVAKC
uniref:Putative secreted protein n=1 Tax=Anopheles triannulatus TaxID=58253 RepID=A0A2M4B7Q4_9DIPT